MTIVSIIIMSATKQTHSSIPVSDETRRLVKSQKRAGQTYDELLRRMVEQYEPEVTNQ